MQSMAQEKHYPAEGVEDLGGEEQMPRNSSGSRPTLEQSKSLYSVFNLSRKRLYGRDTEEQQLLEAYQRNLSSSELVLIVGPSGTGKTTLAQTLRKQQGWFLSGKFEEMSKEPYKVFVEALTEYADRIYDTSPYLLRELRESIINMVGSEGGLLTDLIPSLTKIMGPQPHATHVSAQAALQRFRFVFGALVRGICQVHPLTMFLDDLQWADLASLELIQTLLLLDNGGEVLPLFLLGAHRPLEEDASLLSTSLHDWQRRSQFVITHICLSDWNVELVNQLVSDMLQQSEEATLPLARLVHEQTQGNIFHVLFILRLLTEQNLIFYSNDEWQWDLRELESRSSTELLLHKMRQFDENAQTCLKIAACMGAVDDSAIALILDDTTRVASSLQVAADAGLLVFSPQVGGYKFGHDRIRQAALMLIDEPNSFRLYVGRRLLDHLNQGNIFVVVTLLNRGSTLMQNKQERYRLADLNLKAGKKAASLSSFPDAAYYLKCGIELLARDHWKEEYNLSLALYDTAAEVEMCNANFERVEELITEVLEHAQILEDKLPSYLTLISSVGQQGDVEESMKVGFHVMRALGAPLPRKASKWAIAKDLVLTKCMLRGMTTDDLLSVPPMTNENKIWCSEVLDRLLVSAVLSSSHFSPIIALRIIQLCIRHGRYRGYAFGLAVYGMVLCIVGKEGATEPARMAQAALAVLEASCANAVLPRVYVVVYSAIHHWTRPLRDTLEPLKLASRVGLETGDVEHSMFCAQRYCFHCYFLGHALGPLEDCFNDCTRQLKVYKQENLLISTNCIGQLIHNLTGRSDDPSILKGDIMDIDAALKEAYETHNSAHATTCLQFSEYTAYMFGDYERAGDIAETRRGKMGIMGPFWGRVQFCYIGGLIAIALARTSTSDVKKNMRIGRASCKQMSKWAESCSSNFLHKQKLLEAELSGTNPATTTTKSASILALYDEAIEGANREGIIHDEALACERASEYLERMKDLKKAVAYRSRAHSLYLKWGATAKALTLQTDQLDPTA
jgi:predicted ATPase